MIGEISALSGALCWAVSAVLYKKALQNVNYFAANLVRTGFAALSLLFILPATQYRSSIVTFNLLALIVISSIIGLGIGDTFYFIGLKKIGVSRTQSISSSFPLYTMILATLFLNEKLTLAVIIGTPLIVLGITIITLSQNKKSDTVSKGKVAVLGVISSIIAALCWGIGLTFLKVVLNEGTIDPIFATFISRIGILPFLLFTVVAAGESHRLRKLTRIDVAILAAAGMLSLGLGGIFLFVSLTLIDASIAIPLSSISPFLSLILASLYVGEKLGAKIVIGTSLIVTGIIFLTFYA